MKKLFAPLVFALATLLPSIVHADMSSSMAPAPSVHVQVKPDDAGPMPEPKVVVVKSEPRNRLGVLDLSCGIPSGCMGEMGIRPFYWLKVLVGAGWNGLAPGVMGSIVLDPVRFGIGPSLSLDVGHYFSGSVPGVNNSPSVEYSFIDPMLGIEMGNWKAWRFYLRGGLSYIDATGSNFNGVVGNGSGSNGITIGNPHVDAWVAPSVKLGMSFYF